jgi:hypothetical protein
MPSPSSNRKWSQKMLVLFHALGMCLATPAGDKVESWRYELWLSPVGLDM